MIDYASLDESEKRTVDAVREFGCQVNFVFDDEGDEPDFCYSISFWETLSQPDVVVFGLQHDLMHSMVNDVYRQCKNGMILRDGLHISDLIQGHDCVARSVHPLNLISEYFGWGFWYYDLAGLPTMTQAYQVVWPGAQRGDFPWDEDCDEIVISQQPALWQASLQQ